MQGSTAGKGGEDGSNECHFSGKDCITWRRFRPGWSNHIDTRLVTCYSATALAGSTDKAFQVITLAEIMHVLSCILLCSLAPCPNVPQLSISVIIPESKPGYLGFDLAKKLHEIGIPVSVVIF